MKKILFACLFACASLCANAQLDGGMHGFGGQQQEVELECSKKFLDVNYAGDKEVYHNCDIYIPKVKAKKYPVVMHIYGSAWFSNNSKGQADLGTIVNALLKAGYAVVCPNHRSSSDAKWPAQINDIRACLRFIRANAGKYNFDTKFIASSGFSSGGHLSAVAATSSGTGKFKAGDKIYDIEGTVGKKNRQMSSTVDAAVVWSGPVDLLHMDCAGERQMQFSPEEAIMGMKLEGNEEHFACLSATAYANPNDPPICIFHGTADSVVPYCQAELFSQVLEAQGIDHEFHSVQGGNHGFNGMYSQDNLDAMVQFLDKMRTSGRKKTRY